MEKLKKYCSKQHYFFFCDKMKKNDKKEEKTMENIALSGKLACGKTVLANGMKEELGFEIISIGTTIKKTCSLLIENKDEFKQYLMNMIEDKSIAIQLIETMLETYHNKFSNSTFQKDKSGLYIKNDAYRDLTQYVATTLRKKFGNDVWVLFIAKEAESMAKQGKLVVCDDLRDPSEKKIFENFGFKIIRLDVSEKVQQERIKARGDGFISKEQLNHPTETALDDAEFDVRLDTDFLSIEEVRKAVYHYLQAEYQSYK